MSKACIDRSDSLIFQHKRRPCVTKYKKIYFWFTYASSEVHFRSTESQTFYWSIMAADDSIKRTQAWQAKKVFFKIPGFVCKRFLPFFPTPSPLFYLRHFSRALWLSFFSPKPYRNACYAGYSDWRFDNLCGSHLQSQSELYHVSWWSVLYSGYWSDWLITSRCYWSSVS